MREWHLAEHAGSRGPMTLDELRPLLTSSSMVWKQGMPHWQRPHDVPELDDLTRHLPPAMRPPVRDWAPPSQLDAAELRRRHRLWLRLHVTGGVGAVTVGTITTVRELSGEVAATSFVLTGAMVGVAACILTAYILWLQQLHALWSFVQPSARTSPGRATLLLLVPLFKAYWGFVALRGLAIEMGDRADRMAHAPVRKPSVGWATFTSVLFAANAIPYVGWFVGYLPLLVAAPIFTWQVTRTALELSRDAEAGRAR